MRNRLVGMLAIATLPTLGSCGFIKHGQPCLPEGERATVLRKGADGGERFVTLKRSNGEEVTCLGDNSPQFMQDGDVVDGWTLTRADATKAH